MNFHKEVIKILYPDGFDHEANHGLWKLKKKLNKVEWESVKQYFKLYNHTNKNISNVKYFGWMTTNPVQVMLKLREVQQ